MPELVETTNPASIVTDDVADQFWRDGAICVHGVFSGEWLDVLRRATDEAIAQPGPLSIDSSNAQDKRFYVELGLWSRMPKIGRASCRERV